MATASQQERKVSVARPPTICGGSEAVCYSVHETNISLLPPPERAGLRAAPTTSTMKNVQERSLINRVINYTALGEC